MRRAVRLERHRILSRCVVLCLIALASACGAESSDTRETVAEVDDGLGTVVVLGQEVLLADVVSLGVKPVAAGANIPDAGFLGMGDLDTTGIQVLPLLSLNIEQIATLHPDTIITLDRWVSTVGSDIMHGLADNVVSVPNGLSTSDRLAYLGEELDLTTEADALAAELEQVMTQGREAMPADCVVTVAAIYSGPSVAAFVKPIWEAPRTVSELGCTLVPSDISTDQNGRAFLSLEQLELLQGDTILLLQTDSVNGEMESVAEIEANPLWQQLPAVQAGRIITLDRLGYPSTAGQIRFVEDFIAAMSDEE